ncbi:acyl carrier protein [Nonlabens dokdonensis]|uniref:Acyl carrier protein n=1 Tax=Nonlabens dokdonensis TaxID=328515 RepID=A0A1Z8APF5_9FLAO|nr:acyl carrier protein [Nonlabens dokdonensis]OUS12187.1 acyl carrier protein [Nonlabens dokdonensis]
MNSAILESINEVKEGKGDEAITSVSNTTHLRDDLGLDSFDLAELTVRIEEKTGVDIFENGVVETIGEIAKQIDG